MEFGPFHTEEDFTSEFRKGNEEAFERTYGYFYDRLYAMADRFLRNPEEARDIVADAFLRIWKEKEKHINLESISVTLFLFVKHRCYDLIRKRAIQHEHHHKILQQLDATTENDLASDLVRIEIFKMIYAEAEKLPIKMKQVFQLTYNEGLKPSEIAERLNLSVSTVKNQRIAAIKTLKKLLENKPLLLAMLMLLEIEEKIFS